MGLNAVLVDRARVWRNSPTPVKVEGTTQFEEVPGPWFKVRLTIPAGPQTEASVRVRAGLSDDGSRVRVVERPTLLFGQKDLEGNPLLDPDTGRCTLSTHDRMEISSTQYGSYLYEIAEDPAPIRKKKKVIGWQCSVARVNEHPFTPRDP